MPKKRRTTLGTYLAFVFSALSILLTLVLTLIIERGATEQVSSGLGTRMKDVARLTALRLDRGLFERHREVSLMAQRIGASQDWDAVRAQLEAARQSYKFYAWLAVTDGRGVVRAATGRVLEGRDMSERPWYRRTLGGVNVGGVRDALQLKRPTEKGEGPLRVFDVAFQLPSGGVLVAAVAWDWAEDVRQALHGTGATAELEPVILSGDGVVLLGPKELEGGRLDLASVRRVAVGDEGHEIEEWPDQRRYLVGFSPTRGYLGAPGVGWKVLVREDLATAYSAMRTMQWRVFFGGLALALGFTWLGWATAREVTRPLKELAADAKGLERGAVDAVRPSREYAEVEELAGALNSLVVNLKQQETELSRLNQELELRVQQRTQDMRSALGQALSGERRIQAILEAAQDPFIGMDLHGRITDWNPRAEVVFGWAREEVLGRTIDEIIVPSALRSSFSNWLREYLQTGRTLGMEHPIESTLVDRRGREFPVELRTALVSTGQHRFFGTFVQDISERKAVERLKDEFVSTVSHELRTPLTAIYGSLNLLKAGVAGPMPTQALQLLGICHQSTERLIRLINDMLDVEKIASGRMEFRMQPRALRPLLEQAVRDTQPFAEPLGVRLELLPGDEARVMADADRIVQVCVNLLSNAAKFSPREGVVEMSMRVVGNRARVSVVDHGPGVPAQFRSRIFQRFSQADASDTRANGGTGLGLNICRNIVEAHQGRIDFTSEPNVRTEFFFELPLAPEVKAEI